ncbi:hypothetical protein FRC19_004692 [Serendipita sp. 401]|nr:hypothetical protein FRC19_004692 [Serendipita sp. 401]
MRFATAVASFALAALSVTASPVVESRDLEIPSGFNITSMSVIIPIHPDNFAAEHDIDNE